ncbi:MAG TPA: nucleotidyltransferase family protein [Methylomirabilota bacterium]|nr:nucleotidyltransferase family protein [Methylomirabilota bacterium]
MTGALTIEDQLLVSGAHPVLSAERERGMSRLLALGPDWSRLVADAERHGLAALLHGHLCAPGVAGVPAAIRESLARSAWTCVAWNLRLRHELGRLLTAFDRGRVAVMPLKGPVLADQLYPDPMLRSTGDLDLLVRSADRRAAEKILQGLGCRRLPAREQGTDYHTVFVSDDGDAAGEVLVELHHELGERHVSGPDVRAIWDRASPSAWAGLPIWSMALPDLLVYLCFHAAKDGLASLRALLDITLLIERHRGEIPWAEVTARARAAHVASPVYLSLGQSRALLGAPVPEAVLGALRPCRLGWGLSLRLFRWRGGVLHVPQERLVGPFMAILMILWEDSPRRRLRQVQRNLLPSPRLRERWTDVGPAAPWVRWYPVWLWCAVRQAARQLRTRPRDAGCC